MPQTDSTRDSGASSQRPERVRRENHGAVLDREVGGARGREVGDDLGQLGVGARELGALDAVGELVEGQPAFDRRVAQGHDRARAVCVAGEGHAVKVPAMGYAELGTVRLHYVEQGEGPLVVLLHGFPEFWYGWRHQIAPLAEAGFRVVAPDLRGYNLSSKPRGRAAYALDKLARDVAELIEERGAAKAHVAGHDWGGAVAWATAMYHPERVERLAILNAPHPRRFKEAVRRPRQALRSWYFGPLPAPVAARAASARRSSRSATTRATARRGSSPARSTAMLNYYRAITPRTRIVPVTRTHAGHLGRARSVSRAEHRRAAARRRPELRAPVLCWTRHIGSNMRPPDEVSRLLAEFFSLP